MEGSWGGQGQGQGGARGGPGIPPDNEETYRVDEHSMEYEILHAAESMIVQKFLGNLYFATWSIILEHGSTHFSWFMKPPSSRGKPPTGPALGREDLASGKAPLGREGHLRFVASQLIGLLGCFPGRLDWWAWRAKRKAQRIPSPKKRRRRVTCLQVRWEMMW